MQSTKWELYEYQRSRSVIDFGPNHLHSIFLNFFSSITADFNISSAIRWAIQDQWSSGFLLYSITWILALYQMLIQNLSLVCELTIEILSKQTQIFKTFFFQCSCDFNFRFNRQNPTDYLHVNRVVVNQTFHPKSVSPAVLDQEQFACIISLIFS